MADAILVCRACGKGSYQVLEVDLAAPAVVAAWPEYADEFADTPRTAGRPRLAPSKLDGDAARAYRVAVKAWDKRAFNFDDPAPAVAVSPAPVPVPVGCLLFEVSAAGDRLEGRDWVARIDGADARYRFARTFPTAAEVKADGTEIHHLAEGVYEAKRGVSRRYFRVAAGVESRLTAEAVAALFPAIAADASRGDRNPEGRCPECGYTHGHRMDCVFV